MDYSTTPTRVSWKMSSSLKEKLKKLGRYHGSGSSELINEQQSKTSNGPPPISNFQSAVSIIRLKVDKISPDPVDPEPNIDIVPKKTSETELSDSTPTSHKIKETKRSCDTPVTTRCLKNDDTMCKSLKESLEFWRRKEKLYEERLRKLKLVKLYQTKNNLSDLEHLIVTWRTACQAAIIDLLNKSPEPKPSILQLLTILQIDPKLISYDPESESFR